MAAKGSIAKIEVGNSIIGLFEDAFWNGEGKEIRINTVENGEPMQVKIALTVAKVALSQDEVDAVPGIVKTPVAKVGAAPGFPEPKKETINATDEERAAVADLMASLGL